MWVDGERAYDLARQNKEVELKAREIEVYDYQIIDYKENKLSEIKTLSDEGIILELFCIFAAIYCKLKNHE